MTITIPTPNAVFAKRKAIATPVALDENVVVRPGLVEALDVSDGVVKAKNLQPGQVVRPWVRNRNTDEWEAMGAERIVRDVDRLKGGSQVHIHWASLHADEIKAASYRFYCEALVGTPVTVHRPGFVAVR